MRLGEPEQDLHNDKAQGQVPSCQLERPVVANNASGVRAGSIEPVGGLSDAVGVEDQKGQEDGGVVGDEG